MEEVLINVSLSFIPSEVKDVISGAGAGVGEMLTLNVGTAHEEERGGERDLAGGGGGGCSEGRTGGRRCSGNSWNAVVGEVAIGVVVS